MNGYVLLANVIVFIHLLYVAVVVLAVPTILIGWWRRWSWVRNFWFRLIHLVMMAIVVVETVFGCTCPLTTWEGQLRIAGEELVVKRNEDGTEFRDQNGKGVVYSTESYESDFVGRLLQRILFFDPEQLNPIVLNTCYYVFGAMVLATFLLVPPRWPWWKS